ncbi:MAG: glycosyltransferase [Planctomycetota bacterium]
MPSKVLVVTDALLPPARGNGTTVARWIEGLTRRGHEVEVVEPGRDPRRGRPDVVLGYHADRCGPFAVELAERFATSAVIALGGTDLLALEESPDTPGRRALERAHGVTAAFATARDRLESRLRSMPQFSIVRRGVFVDPDVALDRVRDPFTVALPSGLRPVKDPLLALQMLRTLRDVGLRAKLIIVGSDLDSRHAEQVRDAARRIADVHIGARPPVAMGAVYARSLVVWNTSRHEGGANAVLEAAALGCAVLLRDSPGNRELAMEAGSTVTLFDPIDRDGIVAWHRTITEEDDAARNARHERTIAWLRACHDPSDEIDDLERALCP